MPPPRGPSHPSSSRDIVVDPSFLAAERLRADARARRFESAGPPPPLPKRNFAHPGGKIVTSDPLEKLQSFIERLGEDNVGERALQMRDQLVEQRSPPKKVPKPPPPRRLYRSSLLHTLASAMKPWALRTSTIKFLLRRRRRRIGRSSR